MNFWTPTFHSWGKDLDAVDMPWYVLYDYVEVFTYDEADRILIRMVDERWTEDQLVEAGFDRALVEQLARRIVQNQYKRLPPIIAKLSSRTINQDFRYLRSWGH